MCTVTTGLQDDCSVRQHQASRDNQTTHTQCHQITRHQHVSAYYGTELACRQGHAPRSKPGPATQSEQRCAGSVMHDQLVSHPSRLTCRQQNKVHSATYCCTSYRPFCLHNSLATVAPSTIGAVIDCLSEVHCHPETMHLVHTIWLRCECDQVVPVYMYEILLWRAAAIYTGVARDDHIPANC